MKVTCDYCFEDHFFENESERPESCKNCNSPLQHIESNEEENAEVQQTPPDNFTGIRLRYKASGEFIDIPHSEIVIVGRLSQGGELLKTIPQVSREHCKIEFIKGKYFVTDLNSLNGTYIGASRRDCLKHQKQELRNGDVLYLGREAFLISLHLSDLSAQDDAEKQEIEEEFLSLRYKCKDCGKVHDMNLAICDACGSYGQIEPLDS